MNPHPVQVNVAGEALEQLSLGGNEGTSLLAQRKKTVVKVAGWKVEDYLANSPEGNHLSVSAG